jgi:PAS domain S-box-containing protein
MMRGKNRTPQQLLAENKDLRRRLKEAEKTLRAVQRSQADAPAVIVTDRPERAHTEQLLASEELARSILEQAADGIVVCNKSGVIIRANPMASQLCGENPLLKSLDELFPVRRRKDGKPYSLRAALRGRTIQGMEADLERADGQSFNLLVNARPLKNPKGKIAGCVVTLTDVTALKETEAALKREHERLKDQGDQLKTQNEQLGSAQLAIEESRARYADLYDSAPVGFLTLNQAGRIVQANLTAAGMLGIGRENLIGQRFSSFVAPESRDTLRSHQEHVSASGGKETCELRTVRKDGASFFVAMESIPAEDSEGNLTLSHCAISDITEQKRAEEELHQLNRTLQALSHSSQAMMHAKDESEYLEEVCNIIVKDCGHTMVWIGFAENDENKTVRPVAYAGFEQGYLETLKITWADTERGRGPTGTAIRTGKPSMCRNMLTDPAFRPWREQAIKRGYASSVVLPLMADDKAFGAINIYSKEPDPFSEDEVRLLGELADDLSYGIAAIRLRVAHTQAEEALRETRDYLEKLFNYANAPIIVWDPESRITRFNHAFEHLTGYRAEEVIGQELHMLFPDASREESLSKIARTSTGEYWESVEIPIRRKDGATRIALWNSANLYAEDGTTLLATIAQGQDITERKWAEKEREEHLARLNTLLWTSTDILREQTMEGLLRRVADGARQLTNAKMAVTGHGYREGVFRVGTASRAEDAWGCPPGEVFAVRDGGVYLDLIYRETSIRLTDEQLRQHPSYKRLPEDHAPLRGLLGARLTGRDGQPVGLIMVSDREQGDFTPEDEVLLVQLGTLASLALQHIEAKQDAERRADELDAVFGAMTDAVMVYDDADRVVRANPAAVAYLGFDPTKERRADIVERLAVRHPDGRPVAPDDLPAGRARRGQTVMGERYLFTSAEGREMITHSSASPLWANDKVSGVVTVWHDATERERAAEEIRKLNAELNQRVAELRLANQEMEAFSYSVSHDLRSPLAVIGGFSHVLLEDYSGALDEEARRFLDIINTNARKMGQLIDDLLAFSRTGRKEVRPAAINMEELLRGVFEEIRLTAPGRVVELELKPLPPARGDWSLVRQVLANLLSNAVKFTRLKEKALIEVGGEKIGKENRYYVKDNGVGFDMEYADRMFGVFQRLHSAEEFEGSGVGLAIVQRIVERHGGRVWAEGKAGEGATFSFTLPCEP